MLASYRCIIKWPQFSVWLELREGLSQGLGILGREQSALHGTAIVEMVEDLLADGRLIEFEFNTEQVYVLWFGALKLQVFKDDELVTAINGAQIGDMPTFGPTMQLASPSTDPTWRNSGRAASNCSRASPNRPARQKISPI